jgi:putative ABC transport system permease protein
MFYARMAWRSLRHTRGVTVVMVGALALGIGTWYAQRQIFAFLASKRPAAAPHIENVALEREPELVADARPQLVVELAGSLLLASRDARAVLAAAPGRRTMTFGAPALLEPEGMAAETVRVRYSTADLFPMFEIPLVAGAAWSDAATDEAMVDERLARRLFGSAGAALGRTVTIAGDRLRIVGVIGTRERARYHLYERFVAVPDDVYLPLARGREADADFRHEVAGGETGVMTAWVELATPAARATFSDAAAVYLGRERATGRPQAPRGITLRSADEMRQLFDPAGTLNLWPLLSGMCLVTCIANLVRMLMVKFAGRRHDLGLLRAFGARRRGVMGQLLLEALAIGLVAGLLGVALGVALMPLATATLAGTPALIAGSPVVIDASAVLVTVGASVGAALAAALYPAWLLSRGTPAAQLGRS